jgi:hypothetical protein
MSNGALNRDQFQAMMGLNKPEPVTSFVASGLNAIKQPLDYYAIDKRVPLVGGQSIADLIGLTGTQSLVQDFSQGKPMMRDGLPDERFIDAASMIPMIKPAAIATGKAAKSLGKEALRQGYEGTGVMGMIAPDIKMPITAFHGSPYKFDKFNIEKTGTGSGKNLFGEGVYTSELPKEAKGYMTSGSSGTINYNGKLMNRDSPRNSKDAAAYALFLAKGNVDDAISSGLSTPEAISKIDYNKITPNGNLYKVDIPDELIPSMIRYGDSIGSQNKNVIDLANKNKESLNKILEIEKIKNPDANLNSIYELSSSKLFKALGGVGKAEKTMLLNGINGVRYPSPVGGINTVVFDPEKIKILERNGLLTD